MNQSRRNRIPLYAFTFVVLALLMWNIHAVFDQKTEEVVDAFQPEETTQILEEREEHEKVTNRFFEFLGSFMETKVQQWYIAK